jgi:hypothetical protein
MAGYCEWTHSSPFKVILNYVLCLIDGRLTCIYFPSPLLQSEIIKNPITLFQVDKRCYRIKSLFQLFLRILGSYMISSRHTIKRSYQMFDRKVILRKHIDDALLFKGIFTPHTQLLFRQPISPFLRQVSILSLLLRTLQSSNYF